MAGSLRPKPVWRGMFSAMVEVLALHSDFDRLGPAVRLALAGVSDQ